MRVHQPLEVFQLSTIAELDSLRNRWQELAAGMPMRSWEWFEKWWRVYGNVGRSHVLNRHALRQAEQGRELYLLAAFEVPDRLVGIAPWYIEHSINDGRTLKFLGSGEICTDYPSILCEPGCEAAVTEAFARSLSNPLHVADWLTRNSVRHWDRIEFEAVQKSDKTMQLLLTELERQDNLVHKRFGCNSWQIALPKTWDAYLSMLSKSHRKQLRRFQRLYFDNKRIEAKWVSDSEQLARAWELLLRFHQGRQKSLGNAGCFASHRYETFHRGMVEELLHSGQLWMGCIELDGKPVAVDYQFVGKSTVYVYQGGIDTRALAHSPGQLMLMATLQRAIAEGYQTVDLLRGDEAYKPHWRAYPQPLENIRVVPKTASNQVRKGLWIAGDQVRNWFRNSFGSMAPTY